MHLTKKEADFFCDTLTNEERENFEFLEKLTSFFNRILGRNSQTYVVLVDLTPFYDRWKDDHQRILCETHSKLAARYAASCWVKRKNNAQSIVFVRDKLIEKAKQAGFPRLVWTTGEIYS